MKRSDEEWLGMVIVPALLGTRLGRLCQIADLHPGALLGLRNDQYNGLAWEVLGYLPSRHLLRKSFALVIVGQTVSMAARWTTANHARWTGSIAFAVDEIESEIQYLNHSIGDGLPPVQEWLEKIAARLTKQRHFNHSSVTCRLMQAVFEEITRVGEALTPGDWEARWLRAITRIQDAVGWELDERRLYNAIAKSLKSGVGYDFFELDIMQPSGRRYEPVTTFLRNDTAFGGDLLSIILKPDRQLEILRGRHSILVNEQNVELWLMNPKLMDYMELKSGVLLPIIHQRRSTGLLKLFSRRLSYYKEVDLVRLAVIARIIAKSLSNSRLHSAMRRMATVDGLTNVCNHRFFVEQLNREWKRARRYGSVLSLLMLDIDHFKHYNDANGHLQGDRVLAGVAQVIKNSVREVDIVCRYGGEEFTIILPETSLEQGFVVAEKIRQNVAGHPFKFGARQPLGLVSVSIGLADNQPEIETVEELVNRADTALYNAKKAGRNRCEIFKV